MLTGLTTTPALRAALAARRPWREKSAALPTPSYDVFAIAFVWMLDERAAVRMGACRRCRPKRYAVHARHGNRSRCSVSVRSHYAPAACHSSLFNMEMFGCKLPHVICFVNMDACFLHSSQRRLPASTLASSPLRRYAPNVARQRHKLVGGCHRLSYSLFCDQNHSSCPTGT